jgi:hypothetical protein
MRKLIKEAYSLLADYPKEAERIVKLSGYDLEEIEKEEYADYVIALEDAEKNLEAIKDWYAGQPDEERQLKEAVQGVQAAHYNLKNYVKNHPKFKEHYENNFWHLT